MSVTGVYIAGVLFLWSPVAVPVMWVVVSAPEMCCLGHNVTSLWGWTYIDLVTHIMLDDILPHVQRTLDYVMDLWQIRRPKQLASWQVDFCADWINMSNCDKHCLTEKQLKWLQAPNNTKGRAECLAQLEVEEHQPSGKYLTEIVRVVGGGDR
jgi:hypothetical protein